MFTGTGLIAFVCIFGASLAGLWLSKKLPERYLSEETHKIVQLTMSPVGLLAALVVGLLVTNAKTGLDTSRREIAQFSTSLRLLDREAVHFGSEAKPVRELLRAFTEEKIAQTWTETAASQDHSRSVRMLNEIQDRLRAFAPQDDIGREARVSGLRMIVVLFLPREVPLLRLSLLLCALLPPSACRFLLLSCRCFLLLCVKGDDNGSIW